MIQLFNRGKLRIFLGLTIGSLRHVPVGVRDPKKSEQKGHIAIVSEPKNLGNYLNFL